MRRHHRDANQGEIVRVLEGLYCSVLDLSMRGGGCTDLLVGVSGVRVGPAGRVNKLIEVKNAKGKNREEASQREFRETWRGDPPETVRTPAEAVALVERVRRTGA